MTSLFLFLGLFFLLADGNTTVHQNLLSDPAKPDKCCNETTSLMLTMVNSINNLNNAINDLHNKVDRLTASQDKCERPLDKQSQEMEDCSDIRTSGRNVSGVYRINIGNILNRIAVDVFCDLESPDSSWLVFQRREDGSEIFERTWVEYVGFGNQTGEFWLGNNALYLLTSTRNYKLRIEMEDFDGQKRVAEYSKISMASPSDNYRLTVSGYSGDAGDSLSGASGFQFSTKDADHDIWENNCAQVFHGAWWYSKCHTSNLNGLYLGGNHTSFADGIEWYAFRGYYYSLKATEMKIALIN